MAALSTLAPVHTARQLRTKFLADGFLPGKPAHVSFATLATDLLICRRMKCPGCRKRTLRGEAWRNGQRYRILARCTDADCRGGAEV